MIAIEGSPFSLDVSKNEEIGASTVADESSSSSTSADNLTCLSKFSFDQVDLLRGLDTDTRLKIESSLHMHKYSEGQVVFLRGSKGHSLYFVLEGVMDVVVGEDDAKPNHPESHVVDNISNGDVFGEMALLLDMPRSATICASTDAVVFELKRKDFEALAATCAVLNERLQAIKEQHFLRFRDDLEKAVVATDVESMDAKQKAYLLEVFKQIDADSSGAIDKDELAVLLTRLAGRFFSDEQVTAMMQMLDQDGNGTIEGHEFLAGLPLLAKWLVRSADDTSEEIDFEKVELLKGIDAGTRLKIIMALKKRQFQQGEIVFKKGTEGNSLFFLQQGTMDVVVGDGDADPTNLELECFCVDQIHAGSVFGELALLLSMPRTATICTLTETAIAYELERANFEEAAASSTILQQRLDAVKEERFARFRHDLETAVLSPNDIDDKQRAYLMEVFKQIDADGSGAIDQDELAIMLRRLAGRQFSPKEVAEILTALDKDGNQVIEAEEFLAGLPLLAKWLVFSSKRTKRGSIRKAWSKVSYSIHKVLHLHSS